MSLAKSGVWRQVGRGQFEVLERHAHCRGRDEAGKREVHLGGSATAWPRSAMKTTVIHGRLVEDPLGADRTPLGLHLAVSQRMLPRSREALAADPPNRRVEENVMGAVLFVRAKSGLDETGARGPLAGAQTPFP